MVATQPDISIYNKVHARGPYLSLYIFVLCLEILFILIKNDPNIKGIGIFEYCYLYKTYADKRKFFLKNKHSIAYLSETVKFFTDLLGLKPNTTKSKIARIGCTKKGPNDSLWH